METTKKRKRFLVFSCVCYYPSGGMQDIVFESDDMEEAINHAKELSGDVVEVFDRVEGVLVYEN